MVVQVKPVFGQTPNLVVGPKPLTPLWPPPPVIADGPGALGSYLQLGMIFAQQHAVAGDLIYAPELVPYMTGTPYSTAGLNADGTILFSDLQALGQAAAQQYGNPGDGPDALYMRVLGHTFFGVARDELFVMFRQ